MKKIYTLLSMLVIAATITAQPCSKLFISEYVEGSGFNKALEIYNPTGSAVNLGGYKLIQYNNGKKDSALYTLGLKGSLASGDVYVIVNSQANATTKANADSITSNGLMGFNGNDVIALIDTASLDTLDRLGIIGDSTNFLFGTDTAADRSFVRKESVQQGTKDWAIGTSQWYTYNRDTLHLGYHICTCTPTAITEVGGDFVKVYPNPNNGRFVVALTNMGEVEIKLYAITGETVYSTKTDETRVPVYTNDLSNGLYIVEAKGADKVFRSKIQVQQ